MAATGNKVKVVFKSLSWAVVSGIIIGVTAYTQSNSYKLAFITALVSVCLKTPFYSAHEVAFDAFWHRKDKKVSNSSEGYGHRDHTRHRHDRSESHRF
jgi:uncharacterized membrane protein